MSLMFTDISIITLTIHQTPKHAGVLSPFDYLETVTSLSNGHDYATVHTQATEPTSPFPNNFAKLNIAGHFVKGQFLETIDPTTGLTTITLPYYINTLSPGCEGVTVENAYEKFQAFQSRLAELTGLVEYNNWLTSYFNEHFTITYDAFLDTSDYTIEWWIDHDIAYTKINNAV